MGHPLTDLRVLVGTRITTGERGSRLVTGIEHGIQQRVILQCDHCGRVSRYYHYDLRAGVGRCVSCRDGERKPKHSPLPKPPKPEPRAKQSCTKVGPNEAPIGADVRSASDVCDCTYYSGRLLRVCARHREATE